MKKFLAVIVLLAFTLPSFGQTVRLPTEVKGEVGEFIQVMATTDDKAVTWKAIDPGLNLFPTSLLKDTKTAIVTSSKAGRYRILAVTAKGDVPSEFAMATVIVGMPGPTPPVPPGPDPPDPTPPIPPNPGDLGPFGGTAGLHVLVVYETSKNLTFAQHSIVHGKTFREYIEAKCVKGPDGKTPQRRIYDKDAVMAGESQLWQDAMKKVLATKDFTVPWVVFGNGKNWISVPLPASIEETMKLLEKVGG